MARYIDADELLKKAVYPYLVNDLQVVFVSDIENQPTADVKPIVRGEWINLGFGDENLGFGYGECSVCGNKVGNRFVYNFCPNCGADMKKE